jgi:hypothetical protein
VDLDEAKLADIAGEGGLSDVESAFLQEFAELFLAADPIGLDELANRGVAPRLRHVVRMSEARRARQGVM